MQNEVEKQFNSTSTASGSPVVPPPLSLEEKMAIDSKSVFVGNVNLKLALNISIILGRL